MIVINLGMEFRILMGVFLLWFASSAFFVLMCLFRTAHWKRKQLLEINVIWTSIICFAFSVFSLWYVFRYTEMVWWKIQRGLLEELLVIGVAFVLNILILNASRKACIRSCKNLINLVKPPPKSTIQSD